MKLSPHTEANKEFFAPGGAPSKARWTDWVERGLVRGKIIDGQPYIDLNWFATSPTHLRAPPTATHRITGVDLLRKQA